MSWNHVSDSKIEPRSGGFEGWESKTQKGRSTETIGHSTYRCSDCRALSVCRLGQRPSWKCGKCK